MTNTEIAEGFFAAVGSGDIGALTPLLADDFVFEDQTAPSTLNKNQFLGWVNSLGIAIPNLSLEAHAITAVGNDVVADLSLAGTVTAALDLAPLGQGIIPASGATLALPPQPITFTFVDGCIVNCIAEAVPGAGIGAILQEIGGIATAPV